MKADHFPRVSPWVVTACLQLGDVPQQPGHLQLHQGRQRTPSQFPQVLAWDGNGCRLSWKYWKKELFHYAAAAAADADDDDADADDDDDDADDDDDKEDAILSKAKPCFSLKIGFLSKYLGILRGPCHKTLRIPNLFVHATFQAAKFCHKVCTNAWVVPVWRSESPLAESTAVGPWEYGNHIVLQLGSSAYRY